MTNNYDKNHIATSNNMGYMTKTLDPFIVEFLNHCSKMSNPIADLGVAYGYTTQEILKKSSVLVYANDLSKDHLQHLENNINDENHKERLHLFPGKLPDIYNFEKNSLEGVLASRCIHFLKGEEIIDLFRKVYNSLIKNGIFCVVAETPYLGHLKEFIPIYEKRKKSEEKWPGFIESLKKYTNRPNSSEWVNLMDQDILESCFKDVGFKILKSGYINRSYFPEEVRCSGKESVGIIGVKENV